MHVIIVGTGGLARELTSFFEDNLTISGYVSVNAEEHQKFQLPGRVYSDDITPDKAGTDKCVIAIGNPGLKEKMAENLEKRGFKFPCLIHPSAVTGTTKFNDGVIISPNCTIGSDNAFGRFVYLNYMVGVGHDCVIGDYVQINPGAQIGGSTTIGNNVLVGSNATIREKLRVEDNSTIGFGSVVFNKIREGMTVIGNPAKRM